MLTVISGFTCIYKCIFLIILNLSSFSERNGESMFCAALLSKKTNLLDSNIKISTWPSFSWFDQSLVISCLILRDWIWSDRGLTTADKIRSIQVLLNTNPNQMNKTKVEADMKLRCRQCREEFE